MKSNKDLNDDLRALMGKYQKQLESINGKIDDLYTQQQEISDAIDALRVLVKDPKPELIKGIPNTVRASKRKAKYQNITAEGFAIMMLTNNPNGMTITALAEEMALPTKAAMKTCYTAIDSALRYNKRFAQKQANRSHESNLWILKELLIDEAESVNKVVSATPLSIVPSIAESKTVAKQMVKIESVEPVASVSIAETKIESKPQFTKQSQVDIFADMGDFTKKQVEKHYPKKAAVMS